MRIVDSKGELNLVLALDLGGTQIRTAAVDGDGGVHHRGSTATPVTEGPDAIVAACIRSLETLVAAVGGDDELRDRPMIGIGISSPGPVDPKRGVVVDPPNLGPAFRDIALVDRLGAALALPAFLDRDTQVAAIGEGRFGVARGCRDYLYLTVSTGIGGAVVSDGRLLRGPDGTAGELGHLLVDRSGPVCGCGGRGHLEAISSGVAIAREGRAAAERGDAPILSAAVDRRGTAFGARDVVIAAGDGDAAAERIVADACDAVAAAAVTLVDVFNPELIIIGGSLGHGLGERLLGRARAAVASYGFRAPAARVRFVLAELGDDVGLIGARVLVESRLATA